MTGQLGTVGEAKPGWPGVPERTWVPGACEGVTGREAGSVGGLGGRRGTGALSTGRVWPLSAGVGGGWSLGHSCWVGSLGHIARQGSLGHSCLVGSLGHSRQGGGPCSRALTLSRSGASTATWV